jgi:predicted RNase H-like nuclease (RuvC/YqgF family)
VRARLNEINKNDYEHSIETLEEENSCLKTRILELESIVNALKDKKGI